MKKIISIALIIMTMFLCAGCGKSGKEQDSTDAVSDYIITDEIIEMAERVIAEAEDVLNGEEISSISGGRIEILIEEYKNYSKTSADEGAIIDAESIRSELAIYDANEKEYLQKYIDYLKKDLERSENYKNN